jgi:F-type H+-transporting ATPase subunit alpha
VGGNAQIKAMKQVAGKLRLELAQYRDLSAFAQFSTDMDKATKAQLDRGARLVEILKQDQYELYPVEEQVALIFCATSGYVDDVPLEKMTEFKKMFLVYYRVNCADISAGIRTELKLTDDMTNQLKKQIEEFKRTTGPVPAK